MKTKKTRELWEKMAKYWFLFHALIGVISVLAIIIFVFYKGLQPFWAGADGQSYPIGDFLTGLLWKPNDKLKEAEYGIFFMIVGSVLATGGAIVLGVPVGVLTAVYISQIAGPKTKKILMAGVELLAGIPSVLYGIFGLGFLVPVLMKISPEKQGQSLLAAILVLAIMILPTVISISESALKSVPRTYLEASYGLGASKMQTIFKVLIPAAKSGILTGIVLGIGRAIGETMAVMLVAGNVIGGLPQSLWSKIRPLTVNIALEMSYASGFHQQMLFSTGVVLFLFIIAINLILNWITSKSGR